MQMEFIESNPLTESPTCSLSLLASRRLPSTRACAQTFYVRSDQKHGEFVGVTLIDFDVTRKSDSSARSRRFFKRSLATFSPPLMRRSLKFSKPEPSLSTSSTSVRAVTFFKEPLRNGHAFRSSFLPSRMSIST